jgi:hypothetical protein
MKSALECFAYVRAAWDAKGHAGIASKTDANSKGQTKKRSHYWIPMKQDVRANPEQTSLD